MKSRVLVASGVLLVAILAIFFWRTSHDPFAGLKEEADAHDSGSAEPGSLAERRQRFAHVQDAVRDRPNDVELIAEVIHLGLEFSPEIAVRECERILERSPRNHFALHHAALGFLALTNFDRAMNYAARALQVKDTAESRFVVGHVFYARSEFNNALTQYRAALQFNPGDRNAQEFVRRAEQALAESKKNPSAATNLPTVIRR